MAKRSGGRTTKQARAQRSTHPATVGRGKTAERYTNPRGRKVDVLARRHEASSGGPRKGGPRP